CVNLLTGFADSPKFISDDKRIKLEDLSFALQHEKNKSTQLICFTEKITENDRFTDLNIHHKYYVKGKMAWEYDNESLITLCERCHQKEHEDNSIPVYDNEINRNILFNTKIC